MQKSKITEEKAFIALKKYLVSNNIPFLSETKNILENTLSCAIEDVTVAISVNNEFCSILGDIKLDASNEKIHKMQAGIDAIISSCNKYRIAKFSFENSGIKAEYAIPTKCIVEIPDVVGDVLRFVKKDITECRKALNRILHPTKNLNCKHQEKLHTEKNMNKDFIIKGTVLKKYIGKGGDAVIPEGITKIAENAFSGSDVCSIIMPSSVTKLGYNAIKDCDNLEKVVLSENISEIIYNFNGCYKLKSVEFPKGITKIKHSFCSCKKLEKIFLSESVKKIERSFESCKSLKRIIIDKNNPYFSSEKNCLYNKSKDKLIRCFSFGKTESFYVPDTVTEIKAYAFASCGFKKISMNDNVKKIGTGAFYFCLNLCEIRLSEKISTISEELFYICENLKELHIPQNVKDIKRGSLACGIENVVFPALNNLEAAFYFSKPQKIELQEGGNYIVKDNCIFTKNEDKLIMALPCFNQESYTIPESVTELSEFAFSDIDSLKKIVIKHNLITIKDGVFGGCVNLTDVTLPENITEIPDCMFGECIRLKNITLPDGLKVINSEAFLWCYSLKKINIPSSVTHIHSGAFGASGIEEVNLNMVEYLSENVFYGCESVKKITVSENNPYYTASDECIYTKDKEKLLFYASDCPQKILKIPDCVKELGNSALRCMQNVETLYMSNNIKIFQIKDCKKLKEVYLPDGLKAIPKYAFYDNPNLERIYYKNKKMLISSKALSYCEKAKFILIE